MEKNLPFVSLSLADNGYNKLVIPFLGKLDGGSVFKNIITLLLSVLAVALLLGGIYLSVDGLFGDDCFIQSHISGEGLSGGKKAGAVVGLIVGFATSILAAWSAFSILKKRTEQMKTIEYDGLLSFVFVKASPRLILVTGELLFVLYLYMGILQIIAALVGSSVYAPLLGYTASVLSVFPGMEYFSESIPQQIVGDYDNFGQHIKIGIMSTALSFLLLIIFYIYKEIYNYIMKLATNLISFLPKFAIPIAIRKRNEN
ncbi:MAG: hypothetical protein FJ344_05150 [Sphingomonadales bacterium]|nr:hypothetical protein [Sphingomonadales bacterium]